MNDFDWQMMRSLADVQTDQSELAKIINQVDFAVLPQSKAFALEVFELTAENVAKHISAAKKLAGMRETSSIKNACRITLLRELIANIDRQKANL